jgi:hypothetical protein
MRLRWCGAEKLSFLDFVLEAVLTEASPLVRHSERSPGNHIDRLELILLGKRSDYGYCALVTFPIGGSPQIYIILGTSCSCENRSVYHHAIDTANRYLLAVVLTSVRQDGADRNRLR